MSLRCLLVGALFLTLAGRAFAGHGFMNSFADVEWLPEPGCTPSEWCYTFDTFGEHVMALIARLRGNGLDYSLTTAREKLAELSAMIKAHDDVAAARARERYVTLIAAAAQAAERTPDDERAAQRERYMNAVIEQVYILTVDYVDMPLGIRANLLRPMFERAMAEFAVFRETLSAAQQKALFFKEEEIRWSLEMTVQADAQKITNEFAGD